MNKLIAAAALVMAFAVASSSALAVAAETTLSGTLVCAQCKLQKPDEHECQDLMIV